MDTPTGRPTVCRKCGKVNRGEGPDCERCGGPLRSDERTEERLKTSPGRQRLVTRHAEDGSLEMVRLSPEEADAAEAVEADMQGGGGVETEGEPSEQESDEGQERRNQILFGAVAAAGLLVVLLAWPLSDGGGDADSADTQPGAQAAAGEGPRAPQAAAPHTPARRARALGPGNADPFAHTHAHAYAHGHRRPGGGRVGRAGRPGGALSPRAQRGRFHGRRRGGRRRRGSLGRRRGRG